MPRKGGDDFWWPATNSRGKYNRNTHQIDNQPSGRKNRNNNASMYMDTDHHTQIYHVTQTLPQKKNNSKETRMVKKFRGLAVPYMGCDPYMVHKLPLPPPCWRADAVHGQNPRKQDKRKDVNVSNDVRNTTSTTTSSALCRQAFQQATPNQVAQKVSIVLDPMDTSLYIQSTIPSPRLMGSYVHVPSFTRQSSPKLPTIPETQEIINTTSLKLNEIKNELDACLPLQVVMHTDQQPKKEKNNEKSEQIDPQISLQQDFEKLSLNVVTQEVSNVEPIPSSVPPLESQEIVSEPKKLEPETPIKKKKNKKKPQRRISKIAAKFDSSTVTK